MTTTPNTETRAEMDARIKREHDERNKAAVAAAKALGHSYVVCITRGKRHAAKGFIRGNGVMHPRPLCMPSSTLAYASPMEDQSHSVECKRCLASLAKREAEQQAASQREARNEERRLGATG
jgi:hypothetical protein